MDTAKQGQTKNKATKVARWKIRVAETTETNKPEKSDPGLSSGSWKPLVGYTKPRPLKFAGQLMMS